MMQTGIDRRLLLGVAFCALGLSACARRFPPVELGGAPVSKDATILTALKSSALHSRFAAAIESDDELNELFDGLGPLTVFAPTDQAFAEFSSKADSERFDSDAEYLSTVLRGHIVPARVFSEEMESALPGLAGETRLIALNDETLFVTREEDALRITDRQKRFATLGTLDAEAVNGIIHSVYNILLPGRPGIDD